MKSRDLVSLTELEPGEFKEILDLADAVKTDPARHAGALSGKTLAMIFEKPSLRTRVTFEPGMTRMGGHAVYIGPQDAKIGERESVPDVARNLERWVDGIMARTFSHRLVQDLAEFAGVPVINGLTDEEHPCQALADFQTIREVRGDLGAVKVCYLGDGNNVAVSLMHAAGLTGARLAVATPVTHAPPERQVGLARTLASGSGGEIVLTHDPAEALRDADVVYTDVWASMGQEAEAEARRAVFAPFQVNSRLMSLAKPDAVFMHCLPAHRGEEVTDEVADSPRSVIFQQAENRLHAQNALMIVLMG
jgi:ornithine carbamoyltransferase